MKHKELERYKSGIYKITNLVNGKQYVGSSIEIYNRYHTHKTKLTKGGHSNHHLASAYKKYGSDNFEFEVLEYCSKEMLESREQYYMDTLKPEYNKRIDATNNKFISPSQNTVQKISETLRNRYESGEIKTYKQDHLNQIIEIFDLKGQHIADSPNAQIFSDFVIQNRYENNYSYKEIQSKLVFGEQYQARIKNSDKRIYKLVLPKTQPRPVILLLPRTKQFIVYPNITTLAYHIEYGAEILRRRIAKKTNLKRFPFFCYMTTENTALFESYEEINQDQYKPI